MRIRDIVVAAVMIVAPAGLGADAPRAAIPASNPKNVDDLRAIETRVKEVIRKNLPATVGILIDNAQGSGVIVSADGIVLTAGHVCGEPNRTCAIILPDGRRVRGKTLGVNSAIDSGMMKIVDKPPEGGWPFVEMAKGVELQSGQWTVALGHPGGYRKDRPPVARLGRVLLTHPGLIDTDNTLINGDSGGPLFDLDGKLIGIHSRIGAGSAANIHVPIDTYNQTWDRLLAGDTFDAGSPAVLGVTAVEDDKGIKVAKVLADSPAAKAGVKVGDIILRFNAHTVKTPEELVDYMSRRKPGDEVKIELQRAEKTLLVKTKLAARQF